MYVQQAMKYKQSNKTELPEAVNHFSQQWKITIVNDTSTGVDLAADAIVIADLVADLVAMNLCFCWDTFCLFLSLMVLFLILLEMLF